MLKHLCLFCIFTYICSFIVFLVSYLHLPEGKFEIVEEVKALFAENKYILGLLIAIPVGGYIMNYNAAGQKLNETKKVAKLAASQFSQIPVKDVKTTEPIIIGASDEEAKITIVEFADPFCPHCKMASYPLKAFVLSKPDVQLRYQHFPLSGNCNKAISFPGSGQCKLAKTAYCSNKLSNKGAEALSYMFDEQGKIKPDEAIDKFAKHLQINNEDLKACVESEETQNAILAQAQNGADLEIRGTPAIFWNGKYLSYGAQIQVLEELYKLK